MAKSAVAERFGARGAGLAARDLGRNIFGLAAIAFGLFQAIAGAGRHPAGGILPPALHDILLYGSALGQIAGGIAIQWKGALRPASTILVWAYAAYCLLFVPAVVAAPLVFGTWGNLFEELTMLAAALILLASASPDRGARASQAGRILFVLCVLSFAVYQAVNPVYTATLVPKWIPPGQMFWVIATTAAFALAAIALILRRVDVLATYLLTAMLLLFQVLIWIPAVILKPHSTGMWAENVANLAIAASCWVVAGFLASQE